ncbi:MAG TPA: hypothetical protein VIY48_19800 [Candidatus Paceibacterota bacterium]
MSNNMRYRKGPQVELTLKKTGTVAIEIGDIVKRVGSNGRIMAVSTATDATAIIGVAMTASPTTDATATKVRILSVGHGTIFEFKLASGSTTTAFKFGQQFKLTSGYPQQLTKYATAATNPWSSASSVVAICAEEMEASGSSVLVTFKPTKWMREIHTGVSYTATRTP